MQALGLAVLVCVLLPRAFSVNFSDNTPLSLTLAWEISFLEPCARVSDIRKEGWSRAVCLGLLVHLNYRNWLGLGLQNWHKPFEDFGAFTSNTS